jgi:hypothetical protein
MKYLPLLLLLTIASSPRAQEISKKHPEITARVREINNDSSMTTVVLRNEEFMDNSTDGGGELTGYFKNDQIWKITRSIGISNGMEIYDYYFTKGKLIFVYEIFNGFVYDMKSNRMDYSKTERNFIGRYYFKNNKLIDLETTGHNRFEDNSIDLENTLIKDATSCFNKLTQ